METTKTYIKNDEFLFPDVPWETMDSLIAECCATKDGIFKWYTFNPTLGENQAEAKYFTFSFEEFNHYWDAPYDTVGIEEFTAHLKPKFFEIW